jgi:hypothetical protein
MTLKADANAAIGNYLSEAIASAADASGRASFQYSITAAPLPAIAYELSPALAVVQQNQSTVVNVKTSSINGFSGDIHMFGIPQLPPGMTYSFSKQSFAVGDSTELTLSAGLDALPGNYAMGVGGQSGQTGGGVSLFVTIIPASSLSLGLSPSELNLSQGDSAKVTATLASSAGALNNPTFSVISGLPQGLSATFQSGQSFGTGVLTLSAASSVPAGKYTLNIAASSGAETVNTALTVSITKPVGTFSIAATPVTVKAGNSTQSNITLSSTNSYSGSIALSCSVTSSPQGAQFIPVCTAGTNVTLSADESNVSTTVMISTTAARTTALATPSRPWGAGGALTLAGMIWLFSAKSRTRFRSISALLLFSAMAGTLLTGCGGAGAPPGNTGSNPPVTTIPGTTAGTYIVTVTAIGNDSLATRASATFTLTVQ